MTEDKKDSCGCGCSFEESKSKTCGKLVLMLFLALMLATGFFYLQGDTAPSPLSLKVQDIEVVRSDLKSFPVMAEVARTLDEQQHGLMGRTELPEGKGMLFVYDAPQEVRFWMKDTLIPLDILFVLPDGTISKIVQGAKPHDETPIPSESAVNAVLELASGEVKRMGVTVGDSLRLK